jgi:hypothetical protein
MGGEVAEGEEWKLGTKYQEEGSEIIIPDKIHNLVEKAFEAQLKKFTK